MISDVVVIGGGPAGAICAAQLARRGLSVTILEKAAFPRFHLGESLLPHSMPILDEIGVRAAVEERFIRKYGARFHDDVRGKKDRFSFDMAWKAGHDYAFQVPRDDFDALLLDHARSCGVSVRERWTAHEIVHDATGRAVGVDASRPDDEGSDARERLTARFVVDASGRDALSARAARGMTPIPGLDQTALYNHYVGVSRQSGTLEGDIDIVLFASGEPTRPNWFWFIPFKDGRTSVGAVVSKAWLRDRRHRLATLPNPRNLAGALLQKAISESATATELLANARPCWDHAQAASDFSYHVSPTRGDGWLAIGDAGGFIDPLFSTGVHLAVTGGKLAADAIANALATRVEESALLDAWDTRVRAAAETFVFAVKAFYAGPLVEHLFADDKHAALRRSITSLLAGDVFGDAVWLRDTRLRLLAMLGS